MNGVPYEIIVGPMSVYWAAVGATFPAIDATPAAQDWTLVGTSGSLNYKEDGVTVTHGAEYSRFRALGSTGPRKIFRTTEEQVVRLILADLTLEQYRLALNGNTVTETAPGVGTAGYRSIGLTRGLDVAQYALLVRGINRSVYGATYNAQYQVPVCSQVGAQEVTFRKDEPAGLALDFEALEDPTESTTANLFGQLIMGNAAALT